MGLDHAAGEMRTFADGETIFREGDEGRFMYVVIAGSVEIRRESEYYSTVLAKCEPGEFFGELAMIDGRPHSADAVASGEALVALYDREVFGESLAEDPEFAMWIVNALSGRLRRTTEQLQRVCGEYVRDRTERVIIEKAVLEGELS